MAEERVEGKAVPTALSAGGRSTISSSQGGRLASPSPGTACAGPRPVIVDDYVKGCWKKFRKSYHSVLFVPIVRLGMSQGEKEGRKGRPWQQSRAVWPLL